MTEKNDTFTVNYTNKDIMEQLYEARKEIAEVHDQALKTNGRVTTLEKYGWGIWVRNNPIKFVGLVISLFMIVISDIRHPILLFLTKLITGI